MPRDPEKLRLKWRRKKLRRNYNMTLEDWHLLFYKQDSKCAICRTTSPGFQWCTDHNHVTGTVRGILCDMCNKGLGHLKADEGIDTMQSAIEYIKRANA